MRRRWLLLGVGVLACAGALGVATFLTVLPRSPVNQDNFEKIHKGMTEKEVEAILEGPAARKTDMFACGPKGCFSELSGTWIDDEWVITVWFGRNSGNVQEAHIDPNGPPTLWGRLRRLLPW